MYVDGKQNLTNTFASSPLPTILLHLGVDWTLTPLPCARKTSQQNKVYTRGWGLPKLVHVLPPSGPVTRPAERDSPFSNIKKDVLKDDGNERARIPETKKLFLCAEVEDMCLLNPTCWRLSAVL